MKIILSNSSEDPIYRQIVDQLRTAILHGELSPGSALPSIRQLARDLQISVITTKRAYEELEKERLIDSVMGKGSFVTGASQAFVREQRMRLFEERLSEAVQEGRQLQVSLQELQELVRSIYEEEGDL